MKKYVIFAAAAMFVFSGAAFANDGIINVVNQSEVNAIASDGSDAVAGGIYAQDATGLINVVNQSEVNAIASNGGLAVAGGIDVIGENCTTCGSITNTVNQSSVTAIADGLCSTAVAGGVMAR
jgi:hypothetical protein